jgi:uncharacterized membrane protein YeaQ/YmgE (transglycosylase-associated protein family)
MDSRGINGPLETRSESWVAWPVSWSAVWVGALAAFCTALIIGLVGLAVGAHLLGPGARVENWHKAGWASLIFSVVGAFFSFVVAGWIAARIAGIRRSEPAMLHGAIAWLVAVPLLLAAGALGAGSFFGGWYGGLAGTPAWAPPASATATAEPVLTPEQAAAVTRNTALGAVSALLLGLIGSVLGGWMASGEPMTFTHTRYRQQMATVPLSERGATLTR